MGMALGCWICTRPIWQAMSDETSLAELERDILLWNGWQGKSLATDNGICRTDGNAGYHP